jgi:DNA-binding response OmpR family regulator
MMSAQSLHIELPPVGMEAPTIVVVDDDADVRNLVALKLTGAGFTVHTAYDGSKALSVIERTRPDLVILDVAMPKVSGIEVCQRLRATMRTQTLPVIMLTARTHVRHEYEGLMAGADVYLTKPFSPRDLLAQVWDLLSYTRS